MTVRVTVYSREDCHLCADAIETIEAVRERVRVDVVIEEVDVDDDPALRDAYGERVPYVFVDGDPAFKFRVDADDLEERLSRPRR
ncbi:glutaredoxin family protein [Salarchaeum sp. JOR-1]|uniref:glutaredoxin family protein n=1 Tax=Salarchaeum sp. JOR-1 TaxID=2599399 RepID=UPI001198B7D0|nr:glutaredoxin family protein [Salarchaeum sp. JOR-1]QDX40073.1 glutaredoxin family protein [Salarchaeum sp. JOR-1]